MAMKVKLCHCPNPDIAGGYWEAPIDPATPVLLKVPSLAAASKACRAYIDRNGLGGGNWTGGEVTQDGEVIARVSYNGKVWPPVAWYPGQKPLEVA